MQPYTEEFYNWQQAESKSSAREIVPFVCELIRPGSVIDVGCGVGTWLSVFEERGVENFLGVDGDYVDRRLLQVEAARFQAKDLKQPLHMDNRYDLVVSLEVAEHLPVECAATFIESLTNLGPVVLFSAALPYQGGTDHINEQWPEYWNELFSARGYKVIDCIRKKFWHNDRVGWWYAQNIFLFVEQHHLEIYPRLQREAELSVERSALSQVHPKNYLSKMDALKTYAGMMETLDLNKMTLRQTGEFFKKIVIALPGKTIKAVERKIRKPKVADAKAGAG